jgi:hypothetical protein
MMATPELRELLKKIEALALNPHWTSNRRWTIGELAVRAQAVLDREEERTWVCASCGDPNQVEVK